MIRTGEFHENEIIEVVDGDTFEKCHFYDCNFAQEACLHFIDCVFELSDGCGIVWRLRGESSFDGCLFHYRRTFG